MPSSSPEPLDTGLSSVQPSPSLSSASTGLGPGGECAGVRTEPKNSERNWKGSRGSRVSSGGSLLASHPGSISNPYLFGWGSPRLCAGLGFIVLRVGAGATGGPEAGGKGDGGSCPGALAVHSRFHGDHVRVDVVIGKVIQVGRAAGRERVSGSHTERRGYRGRTPL